MRWWRSLRPGRRFGRLDPPPPVPAAASSAPKAGGEGPPVPPVAEDLATHRRRLAVLTRRWPGEPLDGEGLLRRLHGGGSRPPLLWCYNSEKEFARMAEGLGPDQPLVAMRSLNKVAAQGPERRAAAVRLADHYADRLLRVLPPGRYAVGGNCQGVTLAARVAARLLLAGREVERLVALEEVPPWPFPRPVSLLFGRESTTHNPFLRQPRPQDRWRAMYRRVDWTMVPGTHGHYFTDANLGPLCEAIAGRLAAPGPDAPPPGGRLVVTRPPERAAARASVPLAVVARAAGPAPGGFLVFARWSSDQLGLWPLMGQEMPPLLPVPTDREVPLDIPTPPQPGRWALGLYLCREGAGPLDWAHDLGSPLPIEIVGEAGAG